MNPVNQVLADLWQRMLPGDRRALALIGYCYTLERRLAADNFVPWSELTTVDRMALIRSMYAIGELARDCARELQQARAALDKQAGPTLRESLTQQVADTVGVSVETLERHWELARARRAKGNVR